MNTGHSLGKWKSRVLGWDRVLVFALLLAMVFGLNGIRWGRVECWNRDQMALRSLGRWGKPGTYAKPPFHTFLNHIVVAAPIDVAAQVVSLVKGEKERLNGVKVLASRLLVLTLFLGLVVLSFKFCEMYFGLFAGRFAALALATSAGFVEYNHFLSCDSPLLFWMMLAVYFAARVNLYGSRSDYLLAGLMTAVATNTKYNGLAVGIAFVVAHCLREGISWKERFFSKDLMLGLLMIPVGLFVTNPFMLFDGKRFVGDFMYNYTVTPQYGGQTTGHGYGKFLAAFPEILGWPGAMALALCVVGSLVALAVRARSVRREAVGFSIILSVFLLYFLKIGSFPRIETRFVLPSVPFAILLAGPFLSKMTGVRRGVVLLCAPIFAYNVVCSILVGNRFDSDPRLAALEWVKTNVKLGYRIESSAGSPHWCKMSGSKMKELSVQKSDWKAGVDAPVLDLRMPHANGREELFNALFQGNPWVEGQTTLHEGNIDDSIFNLQCLLERNPDVVSVFDGDMNVRNSVVRSYYADLLSEKYPYKIVFDRASPATPEWAYPRTIDFLVNRSVLLIRK